MEKIIVIGLDGATWDVIMPLIQKNKLPTFKKLLENGAYGSLESTIPPVTGPSWLAFSTSKNPGRLGVYDFLIKGEDLRLKPLNSKYYRGHSVWDYLSNKGYKVGVVTFPALYPPYEINGFMVSGIFALTEKITYPEELKEEIDKVSDGFEIVVNYEEPKYDDVELFLKDLNRLADKQFKVVLHLLKEKDWNLFFYVHSATDFVQHRMWKYIDKNHPLYDERIAPKYAKEFEKFFQKVDGFLDKLMSFNENLFIISDHGFGPQYQGFNLFKWLETKGYIVRKLNRVRLEVEIKTKFRQALASINRRFRIGKYLPNNLILRINEALKISTNIASLIDYDRSVAYCLGHSIAFGAIYINPNIKNSENYEKIRKKIKDDLKNLSKDVGRPIKVTIYEPENIYKGDKVKLAPDLIPSINDYRCLIFENFDKPLFEEKPYSNRYSGFHRLNGIIIAYGKDIKKGYKIENAKIYDVTPTILHLLGLPIHNEMDGRVLMEIFESNSEPAKRKPAYVDPSYYEKTEEEKLKAKIKKLKQKGKI
ncbi:MAG: alkaline phosphatase family protein [Candidatus Jordarchaeum sp.]|uniref:alkaline phosphatase family protein n=1 Tax=Candidatus Jordarchaeum sp. TaxID=2823881 RepID=UPI004049A6DA